MLAGVGVFFLKVITMQRQVYSPVYGRIQSIQPIVRGGIDAKTASGAVTNLGLVSLDTLGQPNGPASLDMNSFIPSEQIPDEVSNNPCVAGPTSLPVGVWTDYFITNYHLDKVYTLSPDVGASVQMGTNGSFKIKANTIATCSFILNGVTYEFEGTAPVPSKPTIISPVDKSLNQAVDLTVTTSAFAMTSPGFSDTHNSTQWQFSEKSDFSTTAVDVTSTTQLTSYTPTALSAIKKYYVRARFKGTATGVGLWSDPVEFSTRSIYPETLSTVITDTINPAAGTAFGTAVVLSADGLTCVSSISPLFNRVIVFEKVSGTWVQKHYITPPAAFLSSAQMFGCSLALSADGNTCVVGAYLTEYSDSNDVYPTNKRQHGMAFVYHRSGGVWSSGTYLQSVGLNNVDNYIHYGYSVGISGDGTTIAVGAPHDDYASTADQGSVSVFVGSGTNWSFQTRLLFSTAGWAEHGARALSLSYDGNIIASGCTYAAFKGSQPIGIVRIYTRSGTTWTDSASFGPADPISGSQDFGRSVALTPDGQYCVVGSPMFWQNGVSTVYNHGKVYLYKNVSGTWTFETSFMHTPQLGYDYFGQSVAINSDATLIAIGAPTNGSAGFGACYLYSKKSGSWQMVMQNIRPIISTAKDRTGAAVSLTPDGKTLAVAAPSFNGKFLGQGAVFILT